MNSKGISPLIATIFLIAVAVALGSIVMSLGQDYVSQASSGVATASCTGIAYEVKNVRLEGNEVFVTIDNQAGKIDGFLVKLFSEGYTQGYSESVSTSVEAYDVGVVSLVVRQEVQPLYELKIVPLERSSNELIPCNSEARSIARTSHLFIDANL
tara:strand:- start:952 stop:1416 length:465 start_codon:yes stop_codon:yes gene_type:complete